MELEAVLAFISGHIGKFGFAPTIREISAATGLRSTNGARYYTAKLQENGWLEWTANRVRTMRVTDAGRDRLQHWKAWQ